MGSRGASEVIVDIEPQRENASETQRVRTPLEDNA
jgi:hypothetical protein